jgi:tRNA 2-selenouridine synthase
MAIETITINEFLPTADEHQIILDVRSPSEYQKGHIKNAVSFPLFDDEERKAIGTIYKKSGREAAIEKGLEMTGPKMTEWVKEISNRYRKGPLYLYCWRGGMRSKSMGWLLALTGRQVYLLENGYKAYRNKAIETFSNPIPLIVLGGYTGTGKTTLLQKLIEKGEQVIDLEKLARHKGSAFGYLGPQPTSEQFSNLLFEELRLLNPKKPVWVEDESRTIGKVFLPQEFFEQKIHAPHVFIDMPKSLRIKNLMAGYGKDEIPLLMEGFQKIAKRLGGQNLKPALEALQKGELETAAGIALNYYDKAYLHSLQRKPASTKIHKLKPGSFKSVDLVQEILAIKNKLILTA